MKYDYKIDNSILTICVAESENCRYAAYLLFNGQVVEKQFYRNEAKFAFTLKEDGKYSVLLYEKNSEGEIVTEETEKIIYKKKIRIGTFKQISFEADNMIITELSNSLGSIIKTPLGNWDNYEAILLDIKDEINDIKTEYGDLSGFCVSKEKEMQLYNKYFSLGKNFEEKYKGLFLFIDRYGQENENFFSEEEFYVSEIVYAALRQTLYRTYKLTVLYEDGFEKIVNNSLEQIREFVIQREVDYDVLLHQEGNVLKAEIVSSVESGDAYFFYLLKDGHVITNTGWISHNFYHWEVSETGVYCAQGYIKRNGYKSIRKSLPVYWTTEDDKKKYEEFLNEEIEEERERSIYEAEAPYCDFAVITVNKGVMLDDLYQKFYGKRLRKVYECDTHDKKLQIISNGDLYKTKKGQVIFSGECILGNKYISGKEDCDTFLSEYEEINKAIGTFTAVEISDLTCKVYTDYFGFGRVFYMQKEEMEIVSNRYDLILHIMKYMNISKELYVDKVKALLSTISIQILQQNIVREMNIRGIVQMLPEERLEWCNGKWAKTKSALGNDIIQAPVFHQCNYRRDVNLVANEIKNNIAILLEDSRYKNIIADLTGGLDSRVIYAALTNFIGIRDRVRINAQDTPGSRDLEIAMQINGIYKFPWDTLTEEWEESDIKSINEMQRSVFVGTYFAYGRNNRKNLSSNVIRFSGGGGDFIARPLYSRKYFGTLAKKIKNEERFVKYVESDYAANLIIDGNEFTGFGKLLIEELKRNPMEYMTTLERFNYLYFAYRNGFHFHNILSQKFSIPSFMPILSKQLYFLSLQTHNLFQSVRLQIDLIETLNPLLVCIPFDGKTDEEDRKRKKKENSKNTIFSFEELSICTDLEKWQDCLSEKSKNRHVIRKEDTVYEPYDEVEQLYSNLRRLVHYCPELKDVGEALFYWIQTNEKKTRNIMFLNNKIQSIVDEML